jgi:glyceraldehyde 3-phosphate dehydrogenase
MSVRVAINGFGRIGRNTLKAAFGRLTDLEFVAVNDLTDTKTLAHLLKHDSSYGMYEHEVSFDAENIIIDGKKIRVYAEKDPTKLPWGAENIDVVLECTGRFTDEKGAGQHITAGAKRVIISAPAKGIPTHVLGVNPENAGVPKIINNASCTTNCIAPVAAILHEKFGIAKALMTTTHSYTADQVLQDGPHKDLRRARGAAQSIIPTSTGAAVAVGEAIPELKGLFDGLSLRVPVPVVSLADFTFLLKKKTSVEEINQLFRDQALLPRWKGILAVSDEPLVSSDYAMNPYSSIVDLELTKVVDGDFVKVVAWYDNEWGYSNRLAEMALFVGQTMK